MNKKRRKEIWGITMTLSSASDSLKAILEEEEETFENMPEGLRESMRGCDSQEAQDILGGAIESIDEAVDSLYGI